jgi:DNA-binding NarL/FixJ family response regulator
VLGLVAQGCSNAQIAEHHVQHIYTKIGVSSRAAAALFAMEHRLLPRRDR